jgi:hypothetical protein
MVSLRALATSVTYNGAGTKRLLSYHIVQLSKQTFGMPTISSKETSQLSMRDNTHDAARVTQEIQDVLVGGNMIDYLSFCNTFALPPLSFESVPAADELRKYSMTAFTVYGALVAENSRLASDYRYARNPTVSLAKCVALCSLLFDIDYFAKLAKMYQTRLDALMEDK